jgi:hypothetical protein
LVAAAPIEPDLSRRQRACLRPNFSGRSLAAPEIARPDQHSEVVMRALLTGEGGHTEYLPVGYSISLAALAFRKALHLLGYAGHPATRPSAGLLSSRTQPSANRASAILRRCAIKFYCRPRIHIGKANHSHDLQTYFLLGLFQQTNLTTPEHPPTISSTA